MPAPERRSDEARATTLALLAGRAEGATLCPSEVARALAGASGGADWRGEMARVHAAVDALVAEGRVRLSWKGEAKAAREGPYRIGRATRRARVASVQPPGRPASNPPPGGAAPKG